MKKYIVKLSESERELLQSIVKKGKTSAEINKKARILLKADQGRNSKWLTDIEIAEALEVSVPTVERTRKRFVEDGFDNCLQRRPRETPGNVKVNGEIEAQIIALVTSKCPEGRSRWTLQLVANTLVELKYVESITAATIGNILKKTKLNHGKKSSGV